MRSLNCSSSSDFQLLLDLKDIVLGSPNAELLRIQYSLMATTLLYSLQHLFGARRSFSRSNQFATQIVYKLLPLAMALTLWLIHSALTTIHVLYPVWASALACNLNTGVVDNSKFMWAYYPIYASLTLLTWTLWLAAMTASYSAATPLQISVLVILLAGFVTLAILDVVDTLKAYDQASKYDGFAGVEFRGEELEQDPVSMRGYKFSVCNTVTTEDIWEKMATTRLSPDTNCADVERLKDTCLSYAFFRLILMKFAGSGDERSELMTRRFIQEGLVINHEDPKRVFRVIEVELGFLFDFFYTKYPVCRPFTFLHLVGVIALVVLVTVGHYGTLMLADGIECKGTGAGAINVVMMVYILIWFKNFLLGSSPNSRMVWGLCQGMSTVETDDEGTRSLDLLISGADKDFMYRMGKLFGHKPWQRKLGQYSFLECYNRAPILSRKFFSPLSLVANLPRVGQDGDYTVPLSDQVKREIVKSLNRHMQRERPLSRGTHSLTINGLWKTREYMKSYSDAHMILLWHIATRFCESLSPSNLNDDADDILVASQLSNYCAYLLAFSPELLPHCPHSTECFFNEAVEQAVGLRMQDLNVADLYHSLADIQAIQGGNAVIEGAILARTLMNQNIQWRVLVEFWSELLLYLAPSNNVAVHREYLARGGEFITHIWALVTHGGIVREPYTDPPP